MKSHSVDSEIGFKIKFWFLKSKFDRGKHYEISILGIKNFKSIVLSFHILVEWEHGSLTRWHFS